MLLQKMGLKSNDRRDFICDFTNGAFVSLKELTEKAPNLYYEMINCMQKEANKHESIQNKWRKRVFGSIGGYLQLMGRQSNTDIIKGIACRSTGYDEFNTIPVERLRNLYNTFVNKQNDYKAAGKVVNDQLNKLPCLN